MNKLALLREKLHGQPGHKIDASVGNPLLLDFVDTKSPSDLLVPYRNGFGVKPAVEAACGLFADLGVIDGNRPLTRQDAVLGLGSTDLFRRAVNILSGIYRSRYDCPVMLMTAPTYGLFAEASQSAGLQVETVPVFSEMCWKLNPEVLKAMISRIKLEGRKPVCFYNVNPHNPTGSVLAKEDVAPIAAVLKREGIFVLDDLAYAGLEYNGKRAAPFACIDDMFDSTLSILSLSKSYACPGLRSGAACGPRWLIEGIAESISRDYVSVPLPSQLAFAQIAQDHESTARYLGSSQSCYQERLRLARGLIEGFSTAGMPAAERAENERLLFSMLTRDRAEGLISAGLPFVRVLNKEPESGYFLVLDFSEYEGTYYKERRILSGADLDEVFVEEGRFMLLPSEAMLMQEVYPFAMRMCVAISKQNLVRLANRTLAVLETLSDAPEHAVTD